MGIHKCTIKKLELKQLEAEKKKWLSPPGSRKKKDPDAPANSNDFVFDRENLKIIKKGQMELL